MIPQLLGVITGKGGVLKTTIASNLSGILASVGYHVLVISLDPQGDLLRDFGLRKTEVDDQGARLAAALTGAAELQPWPSGRDRLDIIAGGDVLDDLDVDPDDLDQALMAIADRYDLIVVDCPPGNRPLQRTALHAARWVLVPTRADEASLEDGVGKIARLFAEVRADANPDVELIGVVLADIGSQSRRILRETRERVTALFGDDGVMLMSTIRHAEAPSRDARRLGRLAHELDRDVYAGLVANPLPASSGPLRYPASAPGVAGDHQRLAAEVAQRITERAAAAS